MSVCSWHLVLYENWEKVVTVPQTGGQGWGAEYHSPDTELLLLSQLRGKLCFRNG